MLTRAGFAMLSLGLALLVAALPTGNWALAAFALAPLAFLVLLTTGVAPHVVELSLTTPVASPRKGDAFDLILAFRIEGGRGYVEIHQALPPEFELVDQATNVTLIPKTAGDAVGSLTIRVRALRRGRYELSPAEWEAVPPLGLASSRRGVSGATWSLVVRPRIGSTKRVVALRAKGLMLPLADPSRTGIRTTDFRDIRNYQRGDARKTINWKATMKREARASGPHQRARRMPPLVNDFETEGRKSVWIFLDCGPHMNIGTNVESAFEASVGAAGTIARHFTERGYRVGFSLFNKPQLTTIFPESGRSQLLKIERALAEANTSDVYDGLPTAVMKARPYVIPGHTLMLVLTRAEIASEPTIEGLRALRRLAGARPRVVPVVVLSPEPYGLAPSERETAPLARALLREADRADQRAVKSLGIHLVTWDPARDGIHSKILRRLPS